MFQIVYTEHARQDLKQLDPIIASRITSKIYFFGLQKNPLKFAKKLTSQFVGKYRFRIGNYRVLFKIDKNGNIQVLIILRIKHRKDIYNL